MQEHTLAIITARGGSKRIPGKNIRKFCGKPILAYSIEAALKSDIFDEVMVSTDNRNIAEIAEQYGAKVPFWRSEQTSGDFATTADVLLEVLREYADRGREFTFMSCIYPTAPFVTGEKLKEAFEIFRSSDAAALVPVVPFSYPPQRGYIMEDGLLQLKWPENLNVRSQDLEPLYHDCGQFYFYRVDSFLKEKGRMFRNIIPFMMSELEVQDIDNDVDWQLAELKYSLMLKKGI